MRHSGGGSTGPGLSLKVWAFCWDNRIFLLSMPYHTWPLLLWHLQGPEASGVPTRRKGAPRGIW